MINFAFKLMVVFIVGCRSADKLIVTPCMQDLQKEVSSKWIYLKDSSYYKVDFDFLKRIELDYKNCLINLNSQQIISIFGKPSDTKSDRNTKHITALVYHISPPCDFAKQEDVECKDYYFYLNSDGKVVSYNYLILFGSTIE